MRPAMASVQAEINVTQFWGHGMMYTALSRMRNKQGLQVKGYSERTVRETVMLIGYAILGLPRLLCQVRQGCTAHNTPAYAMSPASILPQIRDGWPVPSLFLIAPCHPRLSTLSAAALALAVGMYASRSLPPTHARPLSHTRYLPLSPTTNLALRRTVVAILLLYCSVASPHTRTHPGPQMDPRVMEWWEALRAGRRYVNPHAEPGGPWGSPPWCWQDPEQRVLFKGQSPQARRWLRDQRRGVEGGGGGRGRGGSGARRGGGQAPAAAAAEDAGVTSDGA